MCGHLERLIGEHFFLPPVLVTLAFVGWYCGLGPGAVVLAVAMVAYNYYVLRYFSGVQNLDMAVRIALD